MAELIYNEHYFEMANPNIYENEELREPQIQGYFKVYDHFVVKISKRMQLLCYQLV